MDIPATLSARPPASGRPAALSLLSDERLARLASGPGDHAFAAIYRRYHQRLYRYCRSILHDDAEAEDALQSTLASALTALRRGQRDAPLRPWLFRIAHNESISLIRRRTPVVAPDEELAGVSPSAAEQASQRERLGSLVADLRELPDRQRGALLMRELSGLSHEEIAVALEVTTGAAKQAIFEARTSLAEFEEGRAMPCEQIRRAISDGDRRALRSRRMRAHMRDCAGCNAFAEAIPARRDQLQALAPPLPAALAAGVFARAIGSGSSHAGSGAGATGATATVPTGAGATATGAGTSGVGGFAAGVAGKTAGAAASLAVKGLVGVAIVATAATGVTGAVKLVGGGSRHAAPPSRHGAVAGAHHGRAASSAAGRSAHAGGAQGHAGADSKGAASAHRHSSAGGAARSHRATHHTHSTGTRASTHRSASGGRHAHVRGLPRRPESSKAVSHAPAARRAPSRGQAKQGEPSIREAPGVTAREPLEAELPAPGDSQRVVRPR